MHVLRGYTLTMLVNILLYKFSLYIILKGLFLIFFLIDFIYL
jgi:hypothetical protein